MDHIDDKTEMLIEVAFWEYDMESKLKGDLCRSNRDAFKGQVRKVIRTLTPLNTLAAEAHRIAVEHGFTDNSIGDDIALMHSELSEALEDHRNGHAPTHVWHEPKQPIDKPCGIPSEMADVVIRVAYFCAKHGIDLDKAVSEKMEYNASREYKHVGESKPMSDAVTNHAMAYHLKQLLGIAQAESILAGIKLQAGQQVGHHALAALHADERMWDAVVKTLTPKEAAQQAPAQPQQSASTTQKPPAKPLDEERGDPTP